MFKKILLSLFLVLSLFVTNKFADARTLEELGLSQEAVKYLTPAEIKEILNSPTFMPVTKDQDDVVVTLPPNTVDCFDYYRFGSVKAVFSSAVSTVVAGSVINFTGSILNDNDYPIVDGKLVVKIFKVNGNGDKNINGPDVVDEFDVLSGLNIGANSSVPLSFEWKVPSNMDGGEYKAVSFFVVANKFNLSGLSFTDDIIGNSSIFSVSGVKNVVRFDKSDVRVNGKKYYFAAFPPRVGNGKVEVDANLVNKTAEIQNIPVSWEVYSWDAQDKQNLIKEFSEVVKVGANSSKKVSFTVEDNSHAVYYVRAVASYLDTKSILGVRFVRQDVDQFRINFPGITKFPLEKGKENTIFSCFHSVNETSGEQDGKLMLSLIDEDGKVIHEYKYTGSITGSMMGIKDTFVPKKSYDKFSIKAELYYADKVVDSAEMKYDCELIDPNSCVDNKMIKVLFIVVGLLVAIVLFMFIKRKPKVVVMAVLLLGLGFSFQPMSVDAKEVQWNTIDIPVLKPVSVSRNYRMDRTNVTVTYQAEVRRESGEVLSGGETLPVGSRINLKFVPHVPEHIYWFTMGLTFDSPYGEWRGGAAPPAVSCSEKDFVTRLNITLPMLGHIDESYYVPLVIEPPIKSLINLQNLTCGAMDSSGSTECTVVAPGPVSATFKFDPTFGRFYSRSISENDPTTCSGNNIPMHKGGSVYSLPVPVQTIPYDFVAVDSNNPPTVPTITGVTSGVTGQTYSFALKSNDPDGDDIKYGVDLLNTGAVNLWTPATGFVAEGTEKSITKSWSSVGTYTFKAMAQDDKGAFSGWATHTIVISAGPVATCGTATSFSSMPLISNPTLCASGDEASGLFFNASINKYNWFCRDGALSAECFADKTDVPPATPVFTGSTGICPATISLNFKSETGSAPAHFKVYRADSFDGAYFRVGGDVVATVDSEGKLTGSFVEAGVVPGQTYYYEVRAFNSAGSSGFSSVRSVSSPAVCGEIGTCGDAIYQSTYVAPSEGYELCRVGEASAVTLKSSGDMYEWSCRTPGGTDLCESDRAFPADSECGLADGGTYDSIPPPNQENLCKTGRSSAPKISETDVNKIVWTCSSLDGSGTPKNCSANKSTSSSSGARCGDLDGEMISPSLDISTGSLCHPSSRLVSGSLRSGWRTHSWDCNLVSDATKIKSCFADILRVRVDSCVTSGTCLPPRDGISIELNNLKTSPVLINPHGTCGIDVGFNSGVYKTLAPFTRCAVTYPDGDVGGAFDPRDLTGPEDGVRQDEVERESRFKLTCWEENAIGTKIGPDVEEEGICRMNPTSVEVSFWKRFMIGMKDMTASVLASFTGFFNLK